MTTPIRDFVRRYVEQAPVRLHMPGHKGAPILGCEAIDITEIGGADELYSPSGIILESESNAARLFGSARTLYSTEGSSQCIRAMLHLALVNADASARPVCLAGRNAHKSLLYAAALCGFETEWLMPEGASESVCACPVTPEGLERALERMQARPFCVFLTSPDYLGGMSDIEALAKVCHARAIPLLVDNAHGAYLKFLSGRMHPMELGADMCCDSAHKTLPVLTGGAYLHIHPSADPRFCENAAQSMALFGSTSPSYLILQSLDCANALLAGDFPKKLARCCAQVEELRRTLVARGFDAAETEPTKLVLRTDGNRAAQVLRAGGIECEYIDAEHAVMMFSPYNSDDDYARVAAALTEPFPVPRIEKPPLAAPVRAMSVREAMFAPSEILPANRALGRVCAMPTVSCPPAIPIAVSGEVITPEVLHLLEAYGIDRISVVR